MNDASALDLPLVLEPHGPASPPAPATAQTPARPRVRPVNRSQSAFQWLTGMEVINHHTLSDFRVAHGEALEELFVQVLGVLSVEGMVTLERVMHDGTKIKACAGVDSFRRQERLEAHLAAARQQVKDWAAAGEELTQRQRAAQEQAARQPPGSRRG